MLHVGKNGADVPRGRRIQRRHDCLCHALGIRQQYRRTLARRNPNNTGECYMSIGSLAPPRMREKVTYGDAHVLAGRQQFAVALGPAE